MFWWNISGGNLDHLDVLKGGLLCLRVPLPKWLRGFDNWSHFMGLIEDDFSSNIFGCGCGPPPRIPVISRMTLQHF